MTEKDPELMTIQELADHIHCKPHTLAQWRYRGTGPKFVRVGSRRVLYRRADVDAWLDAQTVQSTAEVSAA